MEIGDGRHHEWPASMRIRPDVPTGDPTSTRASWMGGQTMTKQIEYRHADLETSPTDVVPELKQVLLVDPDIDMRRAVQHALRLVAHLETCSEFLAARARLLAKPPDLLLTNLRLEAYNGLHLVYLAEGTRTRCVVYSTNDDPILAREAQVAGAFYERADRLPFTLTSYVNAVLPRRDRRDLTAIDPPQLLGGRRCTDL